MACATAMLISDRPHDFVRAANYARAQVSRLSGSDFDPKVVEVLLGLPAEVLIPAQVKTAAP